MSRAFLVAGLAWGDEGKGATVDYLTWKYNASLVIRYNGGSQAGHNVVQPDGRHHTFQQFGAGMFHPGVRTHLSRFMLINPMNQMREEAHLREVGITDAWQRTSVDPRALIITPFHRELSRAKLARRLNALVDYPGSNSCGQGIGVCREMHELYGDKVLFAGDLFDETKAREKLRFIREAVREAGFNYHLTFPDDTILKRYVGAKDEDAITICWDWYKDWRELVMFRETERELKQAETVVFEGAQGVLLDENHGEQGFNTWTDCTFENAHTLLDQARLEGQRIKVGVIRSYYTRHGAGPFPTSDPKLNYPEPHNTDDCPQGKFKRGQFDYDLFQKAIGIVGGIDWLAINHLDLHLLYKSITSYPTIVGTGPTYQDREEI